MTVPAFASSVFNPFFVNALVIGYSYMLTAYRTEPVRQSVMPLELANRLEGFLPVLIPSYLPHHILLICKQRTDVGSIKKFEEEL